MSAGEEFRRLQRLAPYLAASGPGVPVGVGDDAAVVTVGGADVVVCVDVLVEGVHFRRDWSEPADVGWKALAVNVSDIAAMGAVPRAAVVGLTRPPQLSEDDVEALYRGMAEAARTWDVAIVGGDTTTGDRWTISVTVIGDPAGAPVVRRDGAGVRDVVVLAGRIGAAACAVRAATAGHPADPRHMAAHRRPQAMPCSGRALAQAGATAMIDLSDGLGGDARHLCEASGVSIRLNAAAVRNALADGVADALHEEPDGVDDAALDVVLGGGEDFALLATLPADRLAEASAAVAAAGEGTLTPIGVVTAAPPDGQPAVWLDEDGEAPRRIDHLGYDHG
ncbi:hypothetical protein BH23ACT9_BH23ACT9_18420 [soil metagenome]